MSRIWNKTVEGGYELIVEHNLIGHMRIVSNSLGVKAILQVESDTFTITRTGFWKNSIEISNNQNQIIAKVYAEKWYANTSILEYKNKKYKLVLRNNPLAEYVILENNQELLSYALNSENGKTGIKIVASNPNGDYLLDFLLWYLFVPIITESLGNDFTFLLLLSAQ